MRGGVATALVLVVGLTGPSEARVILNGQVTGVDGKGQPGFVVKANRAEVRVSRVATTSDGGDFSLRLPGEGAYQITVWKPDFQTCEVGVRMEPGEARTMRFIADPARKMVHLESESRDLFKRPSGWLKRVGVVVGMHTGGYVPKLSTLNGVINPSYGIGPQRADAQVGVELLIRLEPYFALGSGLDAWGSDASASSTFAVFVGTISYPAAVEYASELSLRMVPVSLIETLPIGHARLSVIGTLLFVKGKYSFTQAVKVGPSSSDVATQVRDQQYEEYVASVNGAAGRAPQVITKRISADASGILWRVGAEAAYGFTRWFEAFLSGHYTRGQLDEWQVSDYLGRPGTGLLYYRTATGESKRFVVELDGPVVRVGLRGRF